MFHLQNQPHGSALEQQVIFDLLLVSSFYELREGWDGHRSAPLSLPIYIKHQNALTGGIISYFTSTSKSEQNTKAAKFPTPVQNHFSSASCTLAFPLLGQWHSLLAGKRHRSITSRNSPPKTSRNWIIYSISLQIQRKFPQHLSIAAQRRKPALKARNFLSCHQTSYCFQGLNIKKNASSSAHPPKENSLVCLCVILLLRSWR